MKTGSVKANFLYNSLYQVLVLLLPLVTTPYLSRVLGADGIGEYGYHFSIAKYFALFAALGLSNYGSRTIAAVRDDPEKLARTFSGIYCMQLLTSLAAIAVYFGYALLLGQSRMAYVLVFYVVSAAFDINWFFFGIEQFKLTVIRNTVIKLASVACIFLFVRKPSDVYLYGLILSLSFILSQLAVWPFLRKYTRFVRPTRQEVFSHFKPNLVLFIPVVAVSLYKLMDKIMLGLMTDMTEVGYYENTEKIIDIPVLLVASLGLVMLPKMSNLAANDRREEGNRYTYYSFLFAAFLASSLGFGIMAVSPEFVPWYFGDGFEPCIALFAILAPSTVFMAMANVVRTQYLIPMHKDKVYIGSAFLGAITNIVLNAILIPRFRSAGAAIGTLAAEAAVCIYQFARVWKETDFQKPVLRSIPFILAGVVMWLVLLILPRPFEAPLLNLLYEVAIGAVLYFAVLLLLLVIRRYLFRREPMFPEGMQLFKGRFRLVEEDMSATVGGRVDSIDLLRAFGIFTMILGHVAFGAVFDKWIHVFHMPMFFLISGYFYKEQSFGSLLKKRVKSLLVPYAVFGILHLAIHFIRIGAVDAHAFYLLFWENTAENGIPIAGSLWFLTAMFFSELLFWGVQHIKVHDAWKTVIAAVLAISGMALATWLPFRLPLALDVGMVGVGLYQIGKLLRERWSIVLRLNVLLSLVGIVLFSGLGFVNGYINLRQGQYGIWPLFWINAAGMTISLWNLTRSINGWMERKGLLKRLMAWIRSMGRESIVFLCLNQLAILLASDLVGWILPEGGMLVAAAKKAMILILTMVQLFVAQKLIMGTKLRVLTGKW